MSLGALEVGIKLAAGRERGVVDGNAWSAGGWVGEAAKQPIELPIEQGNCDNGKTSAGLGLNNLNFRNKPQTTELRRCSRPK